MAKDKNWIQDAIKKPGALRKQLGVKKGKDIPAAKLEKAAEKGGKLGQRARLAETLKGMSKNKSEKEVKGGEKGDRKLHEMAVERKSAKKKESLGGKKGDKKLHEMAVKRKDKDMSSYKKEAAAGKRGDKKLHEMAVKRSKKDSKK